eukprot:7513837-Pyramimonas_sp.AAC.1
MDTFIGHVLSGNPVLMPGNLAGTTGNPAESAMDAFLGALEGPPEGAEGATIEEFVGRLAGAPRHQGGVPRRHSPGFPAPEAAAIEEFVGRLAGCLASPRPVGQQA